MTFVALIPRRDLDIRAVPAGARFCPRTENKHIQNVTHHVKVKLNALYVSLKVLTYIETVSHSLNLQCAITPFDILSRFSFRI